MHVQLFNDALIGSKKSDYWSCDVE